MKTLMTVETFMIQKPVSTLQIVTVIEEENFLTIKSLKSVSEQWIQSNVIQNSKN